MTINVTVQSNESKQKTVFHLGFGSYPNTLDKIQSIAENLTNYKVKITLGPQKACERINLIELLERIPKVKFYKYENKKVIVEEKHKLASFSDKPFTCEYAKCAGYTVFRDINRKMITKYVRSAIASLIHRTPHWGPMSFDYYCRGHFSMEHTDDGWTLFEIIEKESIEKVKVIEK